LLVVVGTTTVDVVLTGTDRLPQPGDDEFAGDGFTLLDDPARLLVGGNGAITACVHARLGGETQLVSAVGDDVLGRFAVERLDEAGVRLTGLLTVADGATACTAVAVDRSFRRVAYHHPGVSATTEAADLPAALLAGATTVLLTSYHLLPELRGRAAAELLAAARAAGARTALDLGPCVEPVADRDELAPALRETDVVLVNAHELDACTEGAGADALRAAGAGSVVVKLGREGARLHEAEQQSAPGFDVETASTVGAGDAFDAGYLFALARGDAAADALRFANATAALTLRRGQGALGSPRLDEVERLYQSKESTTG
jgi:sugar/nucleoside kinase (ribokinase family)